MTSSFNRDLGEQLLTYLNSLYSMAVVLTRNRDSAQDLVQQTCLKALQNHSRFKKNTNLKAWLYTIMRNLWMNQNRDLRLHKYETLENQNYASIDFDVDRELQRREIQNAILSMPLLQREILILRDIEELSYQEIAYVLSCPIGTVMSRIRRARLCFKDYFNKNMKRENVEL